MTHNEPARPRRHAAPARRAAGPINEATLIHRIEFDAVKRRRLHLRAACTRDHPGPRRPAFMIEPLAADECFWITRRQLWRDPYATQ
jgi:hypothetical protein